MGGPQRSWYRTHGRRVPSEPPTRKRLGSNRDPGKRFTALWDTYGAIWPEEGGGAGSSRTSWTGRRWGRGRSVSARTGEGGGAEVTLERQSEDGPQAARKKQKEEKKDGLLCQPRIASLLYWFYGVSALQVECSPVFRAMLPPGANIPRVMKRI